MKRIMFVGAIGLLSGCASLKGLWQKDPPVKQVHAQENAQLSERLDDAYADGLEQFNHAEYEKAIDTFEKFLIDNPASKYSVAAQFHLGRSYEALEVWSKASESYRRVVTAANAGAELIARAFYRLSFCHEAMGDPPKTIASLLDALARKGSLPYEIARAEAPARLASAYARLGNEKEAFKYYAVAEAGIQELRRQEEKTPGWLPKSLYYMGTINDLKIDSENFSSGIRPLKKSQLYLLQAAELQDKNWSDKAAQRLKDIYQALWRAVTNMPLQAGGEDEILAQRERQEMQWDMANSILDILEELKISRLPDSGESNYVAGIFDFVVQYEEQVRGFLDAPPVGQGKTPAAQQREGLFRRGRTRGDATILEKNLSKQAPDSKSKPADSDEDPNL